MSRIDDLILEHCPDGVEYRKIADLAEVGTGSSDRKEAIESGEYPFYVRSAVVLRKESFEFDDSSVIIPGEGNVGEVFHLTEGPYALHQRAYRVHLTTDTVIPKFLLYCFKANFKNFILRHAVTATVTSIRKPMILSFEIPVPPLVVQWEIVRVLDQFTQLEAELEAELEARKKQYAYYRDQLLSFSEVSDGTHTHLDSFSPSDVRWVTLGEILDLKAGSFVRSAGLSPEPTDFAPFPCYGANGLRGYVGTSNCSESRVIIGRQGALSGNLHFVEGPFFATEHAIVATPLITLSERWLFHALTQANLGQYVTKSAQPGLSVKTLKKVRICLPSQAEQVRIAEILDRFHALINDLSSGLPAEIEARRKQYEHYRDRLLTFPEKQG